MKNGTSEAREVGVDFDLVPSALKRGSIKGWGCARAILVFVNSIQGNVKREIRSLDRSSRSMSPYFLSLFPFFGLTKGAVYGHLSYANLIFHRNRIALSLHYTPLRQTSLTSVVDLFILLVSILKR